MPPAAAIKPSFHYGWVIVFAGMLCILACLGFGRFALGMLLPSMAATLHLSYSQMGFISTANFLGYLASVLVSAHWAGRIGSRRLVFLALLTVALSMSLVSRATGFLSVLLLYMITGIGSGATNVPVMGLVAAWFSSGKRGRAAGFIVIGSGFAIMISGRLIPFLNRRIGPEGWRTSWLILAGLVTLIAFVAFGLLRDGPEEKGLAPVGADETTAPVDPGPEVSEVNIYRKGIIYYLGAIYFLFGYTYVIYATFIVTSLIQEHGFSEAQAGSFWSLVGGLSLLSGPVFGTLSDRIGRKYTLAMVFAIQTAAYLLVSRPLATPFLYLSIGCFGVVAWSIPSIMAALAGDYAGPRKAARIFGLITFIFALGQIAGPAVAGLLAEKSLGFGSSFFMAACFTGAGVVLALTLRTPAK